MLSKCSSKHGKFFYNLSGPGAGDSFRNLPCPLRRHQGCGGQATGRPPASRGLRESVKVREKCERKSVKYLVKSTTGKKTERNVIKVRELSAHEHHGEYGCQKLKAKRVFGLAFCFVPIESIRGRERGDR